VALVAFDLRKMPGSSKENVIFFKLEAQRCSSCIIIVIITAPHLISLAAAVQHTARRNTISRDHEKKSAGPNGGGWLRRPRETSRILNI
jgi:hypothetical protein